VVCIIYDMATDQAAAPAQPAAPQRQDNTR
jgi:hypothetical protein